eukprot:scaffold9446_cov63-Phaeocystis_antarctica.AAC.1
MRPQVRRQRPALPCREVDVLHLQRRQRRRRLDGAAAAACALVQRAQLAQQQRGRRAVEGHVVHRQ